MDGGRNGALALCLMQSPEPHPGEHHGRRARPDAAVVNLDRQASWKLPVMPVSKCENHGGYRKSPKLLPCPP